MGLRTGLRIELRIGFQTNGSPQQQKTMDRSRSQWTTFFKEAKKKSKRKRRMINSFNNKKLREEKEISEGLINHWLNLYNNRMESDDAYEEYSIATVPKGAWGRVT